MMAAAPVAGQLFTWGRNSDGQCGQTEVAHPPRNCALPHPVRGLDSVTHVACGGGQQGCTFAVTSDGALYSFGNNYKSRLGHDADAEDGAKKAAAAATPLPRRVRALAAVAGCSAAASTRRRARSPSAVSRARRGARSRST